MSRFSRSLLFAVVAIGLAAPLAAQTPPAMPKGPPPGQMPPGQMPPGQMPPGQGGPPPGREPPPQAYDDCRGKRAGEAIQHKTPQGMIAAKCMDSPKGLFARPDVPPMGPPMGPPPGSAPKGPPPGTVPGVVPGAPKLPG